MPGLKAKWEQLRLMLQLFKQPKRRGLVNFRNAVTSYFNWAKSNLPGWCSLCETVSGAIADVQNKYHTLALIVIVDQTVSGSQQVVKLK